MPPRRAKHASSGVKRIPFAGGEVEIRQLLEAEDFGPALTPELREQEECLRTQVAEKR